MVRSSNWGGRRPQRAVAAPARRLPCRRHPDSGNAEHTAHRRDRFAGDAGRDGNAKLGVNFLLPYDRSAFHPEWVSGTLYSLGTTSKSLNPLTDTSAVTADLHNAINSNLCRRPPAHPMDVGVA